SGEFVVFYKQCACLTNALLLVLFGVRFQAVERITEALKFLRGHTDLKSADAAIKVLERLLKRATAHCLAEFERLLRSVGKIITKHGETYRVSSIFLKLTTSCLVSV